MHGIKFFLTLFLMSLMLYAKPGVAQSDTWDQLMSKAEINWIKGDIKTALNIVNECVKIGKYEDADRYISSLALKARIDQDLGNFDEAEISLKLAINSLNRVPGVVDNEKSMLHNNYGALLAMRNELGNARIQFQIALELNEKLQETNETGKFEILMNLASLNERVGEFDAAEKIYNEVTKYSELLTDATQVTFWNNYGYLLIRLGRYKEAINHLNRALIKAAEAKASPLLIASIYHNIGTAEINIGNFDLSKSYLEKSLSTRLYSLSENHPDTARTLASIASVLEKKNQYIEGLSYARRSTKNIFNQMLIGPGKVASETNQIEKIEWRDFLETHLRLVSIGEESEKIKLEEVVQLMQFIKHNHVAGTFLDSIVINDDGLGQIIQSIRHQSDRYRLKLNEINNSISGNRMGLENGFRLQSELDIERLKSIQLQKELAQSNPKYFNAINGNLITLDRLQSTLSDNEGMLFYYSGSTNTYVIGITKSDAKLHQSKLNSTNLSSIVSNIRKSTDPNTNRDTSKFASVDSFTIYRELVAPVEDIFRGKNVVYITPDGPLNDLPFSLLIDSNSMEIDKTSFAKYSWLIKKYAITVLPQIGALALHREKKLPRDLLPSKSYIAFADPEFDIFRSIGIDSEKLYSPESLQQQRNLKYFRKLEPLPETADEARLIANALGEGDLMLKINASEAMVKSIDLSKYKYILFATHGVMANEFPGINEPGVVLTPPINSDKLNDGILTASEIAKLKLNADLVLLSACNTAATDGTLDAEGLSGLAKSFFYAGARNLLVSHWAVFSDSTVKITTTIFDKITQEAGITKGQALQASILNLMENHSEYAHPMYWAPFVLVGIE